MSSRIALLGVLSWILMLNVARGDWPRFRGPNCDGICTETGLLDHWPEEGPPLLWKLEGLGRGYSSVTIVGGKLFTMGDLVDPSGQRAQYVLCFDLQSRKRLWATPIGPPHTDGSRCTPTIDGDRVYAIGTEGDLACLDATTGKILWRKNFARDFGGKMMSQWKYSESPLVDGEKLVCTPGGPQATIVALDKRTGKVIWQGAVPPLGPQGRDGAAYTSMVVATINGVRQYVQLLGRGLVGIESETGRFLWGYNRVANRVANISTPIVKDNYVFASTAYKTGAALVRIVSNGKEMRAEEVYFLDSSTFENHHGGMVLVGDYVYAGSGQNRGIPTCIELKTGRIMWQEKNPPGKGSAAVLYADGNLIFRYQDGVVALIEANPIHYKLKGKFQVPKTFGPNWAHPVIHEGKLYLRDNNVLWCYDLRATAGN